MTVSPGDAVWPGDVLAMSEELLAGPGTYDDGAQIRAARIGTFLVDSGDMKAFVDPKTSVPVILQRGDVVIGEINMTRPQMAGVTVVAKMGVRRPISSDTNGTLHVSKIAQRYVQDAGQEFRLGDIIRAKVISVDPSVQLATDHREYGVIKALCVRCRFTLQAQGRELECPNCGNRETRYTAEDYGSGNI